MSIEAMTAVLHHSNASPAGKLVLLGIANHQSDGGAWPSLATLAKYANVTERRVRQLLRELEASGELKTNLQGAGNGHYKTNLYWVQVACPKECDGSTAHKLEGGNNLQRGGKYSARRGEAGFPRTVREPLVNQIPSTKEFFNRFWDLYPRRVGRQDALKAFTNLSQANRDEAILGAERMSKDRNLPEKRFIPYPATWLRREGWLDEPYPDRPRTQEELREEARKRDEQERARSKAMREQMLAEEKYEPPPDCVHGKPIHRCKICIRNLSEKE